MNIVLIDVLPEFERCFKELGHTLKVLRLEGGVFHLPTLLDRDGFSPDFVLQQEVLGKRNYFGGLDRISCPTAFWALDSHLNMSWHMWYARLFDVVLTPHVSLFNALPEHCRLKQIWRFAWPGEIRAFVPHTQRATTLGLCARMSEHRPIRTWLAELLRSHDLVLREGLSHEQMMSFYDATRIIPNECMSNEVNFRLMEGASSGSLVLSPDVGADQDALLEPGSECLIYRDGLELLDRIFWAALRPAAAEKIGRAALQRIQAEHLPAHRVGQLLRDLPCMGKSRLEGTAALQAFWLVLARQIRNGVLGLDAGGHAAEGLGLVWDAPGVALEAQFLARQLAGQVMAQVFHLFAADAASSDKALWLYGEILSVLERRSRGSSTEEAEALSRASLLDRNVLAAASAFALKEGQFEAAKMFWRESGAGLGKHEPGNVADLCALWAGVLEKEGRAFNAGFRFDPERGQLPEDALRWLIYGRHLEPASRVALAPCFDALLADKPPFLALHLEYLAERSLFEPKNWRVQLGFGLSSIKACRVEEGLHELREARIKAAAEGRERLFFGRLNAWRPAGRIWESLLG